MVFLRLVVLIFLVAYSYSMGTYEGPLNAFGKFISAAFFVFAPSLYFLPTFEAALKKQPNVTSIAIVNTFLGWTLVGWVVAMAWAHRSHEVAAKADDVSPKKNMKACPMCAEDVLAAALVCKHCGHKFLAQEIAPISTGEFTG